MKTTLNKIREHSLCANGWTKLLKHLGKTQADDEPLTILTVLESNGLDDALWCLCAVDGYEKEMRLYAVWCARQVQHLMTDPRSIAVLDVAERHANGEATDEELSAARDAARDAAWDAAWAAACDAARAAACDAAWGASRSASTAAARDAAWETARVEGWAGVWAAVWETARAAVWGESWEEAWDAAWEAALDAARAAQETELRRVLAEIEMRQK